MRLASTLRIGCSWGKKIVTVTSESYQVLLSIYATQLSLLIT